MSFFVKIFYDFLCQDLLLVIELNLQFIIVFFYKYFSYINLIFDGEEDDFMLFENFKLDICEVFQLYINKYDDDFNLYV